MGRNFDSDFLPFSRPSIGEREIEAASAALRSGWITTGARTQELEALFCQRFGSRHAVAVSSATAGMHVTLAALNIGPGDEVITPSQTWVSTINLICLLGARPVFVDVDRDTLMLDAERIEAAITPRTKAVVPVHYAGAAVDIDPIHQRAERHGIHVIEDAAHALGTRYAGRWVGETGTAVFSLHAIKNATCAEGGVVVTDDETLADRVRSLKFHGLGVDAYDRQSQGRKPQAEVMEPGYKYNLSDINAAIALVQLDRLADLNARRAALAARYAEWLARTPLQPLAVPAHTETHAWHLLIVRVDANGCGIDRAGLMQQLQEQGIGSGIHFMAVHRQKYYRERFSGLSLPNTEWNSERLVSLPLFPDMAATDVDRVGTALHHILDIDCA